MKYKFKITGPFILEEIDPNDPKYLLLKFSDNFTRKMAKSGNWPTEYAETLLNKAKLLQNQSVYIKTSQTSRPWETTEWMCDLYPEHINEKKDAFASELHPNTNPQVIEDKKKYILFALSAGHTYLANAEAVSDYFSNEDDYLDFSQSFEKDFVASWRSKTAREKKFPPGVKRVRIKGLGNRTKRNGFRVIAAEVKTEESNQPNGAIKLFHILKIDEKTENEDYPTDQEIKEILKIKEDLEKKYPKPLINWSNE